MEDNIDSPNYAPTVTFAIRKATIKFINSLNQNQKNKALFSFYSGDERFKWSYVPIDRNGLLLSEMSDSQNILALNIMKECYSNKSYITAQEIIRLEKILGEWELSQGETSNFPRDPSRYWFSVFGDPNSELDPFSIRIGGHHIGLIATVIKDNISLLPLFFGANPSEIKHGDDKGKKTLHDEEEFARDLVTNLSDDYKKKCIVSKIAPEDILTASFRDIKNISTPSGILFTDLPDKSKDDLLDLIKLYIFRMPQKVSNNYWKQINNEGFDKLYFTWAGSLVPGLGHYYNIKHPRFIIEYDNTQNNANHIHSVMRDYSNDFGIDILAEHYKNNHSE